MGAIEKTKELGGSLEDRIRAKPLVSVGVALSAGFILGGGLSTLVTGPLLRAGGSLALRMVILPAVSRAVIRALGVTEDDTEGANA